MLDFQTVALVLGAVALISFVWGVSFAFGYEFGKDLYDSFFE